MVYTAMLLVLAALPLTSCSPTAGTGDRSTQDVFQGLEKAEHSVGRPEPLPALSDRPLAVANRQSVTLEQIAPDLFELGGREVLEELVLDRALERELARRGLRLADDAIAREERLLAEALERDAGIDRRGTDTAILELRGRRGLGPVRFRKLLLRNARLRRLVEDQVEVTEEMVDFAYRLLHGERVRVRIIVTSAERSASEARARVLESGLEGEERLVRFSGEAFRVSTDASRDRGGRIEPMSPVDTRYPAAIRHALASLEPYDISPVVAIDGGFAVVMLEERIPPDQVPLDDVRRGLESAARTRQERLLMDELARELMSEASVDVLDPNLKWSWESRAPQS